jgi:hypothetical protein
MDPANGPASRNGRDGSPAGSPLATGVAATILGTAVAANGPVNPNTATLGAGNDALLMPGSDPHLAADVAALSAG